MKNKVFALLLSFAMLFTMSINVAAMNLYPQQSSYSFNYPADRGKKFIVNFVIDGNEGYNNSTFRVKYDPKVVRMVENEMSDLENDGFMTYDVLTGISRRLFTNSLIESQLNLVPAQNDKDYEGLSDGKKTASEIGIVKIGQFVSSSTKVYEITNNGIFIYLTFEVVGPGDTDIEIVPAYSSTGSSVIFKGLASKALDVNIDSASVSVKGSTSSSSNPSDEDLETKTETETETTTSSRRNQSRDNETKKSTKSDDETKSENKEDEIETTTSSNITTTNVIKFDDISQYPWAENAINTLASNSIINGVGNGKFNPSANVKRADFLLMLMKALKIEGTASASFEDVSSERYYANAVNLAKEKEIANGDENGHFNPENNISRQDMMVLAYNALKNSNINIEESPDSVLDKFSDKSLISEYAIKSLASMVNAQIVNGMGDSIQPKGETTRAQAAVIIYNIYKTINK